MNYLKLFEGFNSRENFDEISKDEYGILLAGEENTETIELRANSNLFVIPDRPNANYYMDDRWIKFTKKEISILSEVLYPLKLEKKNGIRYKHFAHDLNTFGYYSKYDKNSVIIFSTPEESRSYISNNISTIFISKFRDDWYAVQLYRYVSMYDVRYTYYKCDGWVGLKGCLKYIKDKI